MLKRSLALGIVSGVLAGLAGVLYAQVYRHSLGADFTMVAPAIKIMAACLFGGVLAAIGFALLNRWLVNRGEIVFNLLFTLLTIISLVAPFAAKLPLDAAAPELFPGMVIPMHFFPALAWFTLKPIFIRNK